MTKNLSRRYQCVLLSVALTTSIMILSGCCLSDRQGWPVEAGGTPITPEPAAPRCTAKVKFVKGSATGDACVMDAATRSRAGVMDYPCTSGVGSEVKVRFGEELFEGWITKGEGIDVKHQSHFDGEDGCEWVSWQRLRGPLHNKKKALQWSCEEQPSSSKNQEGCAEARRGKGKFEIK